MSADKYISINDLFLDIVAGMSDDCYFYWGDLKTEKIQQINDSPRLPLIFMILPSGVQKTGKGDTIAVHRDIELNFLIIDRYKSVDNKSEYSRKQERLQNDVNEAVGQLMYNFCYAVEKSNHIIGDPKFSFTEQLPLGLRIRDNESGKTQPIFDGRYCGFMLTVKCDIRKYKNCNTTIFNNESDFETKTAYS